METTQLEWLLYRHPSTRNKFGGVLARDQIPIRPSHTAYIINLDPSSEPGSHWVAIFFDRRGFAEYFDSFSLPPPKDIVKFLETNSFVYTCNGQQLQHVRTAVCGQYCVYFLIGRCSNKTMSQVLQPFSTVSLMSNDRLVFRCIRRMIITYLPLYNPNVKIK
jgi:hypothetical protein